MLRNFIDSLLQWIFGPKLSLEDRIRGLIPAAIKFEGVGYRSVSQRYATRHDIASVRGSIIAGGRYNFKGTFGVLYLSADIHTCIEEATRATQRREFEVAAGLPRTTIGVRVKLTKVLDLTDPKILRRIGVSQRILKNIDWQHIQNSRNEEAITQSIAKYARDAGFEGLLVPSAVCDGKNIDIFTDRLESSSLLSPINDNELSP